MAINKLTTQEQVRPELGEGPNIRLGARQKRLRVFEAAELTAQAVFDHEYRDQLATTSDLENQRIVAELKYKHQCALLAEILRGDIISLQPITDVPGEYRTSIFASIEIKDFIGFANDLGIEVTVEGTETGLKTQAWPWGDHETELLKHLAAAASHFYDYSKYDPDDASSAPTNKQVVDWLKQRKVSKTTAEVMATILRPDNLPTGPRR